MSEWHYIEKDGNPEDEGYYLVACETYVSFSDDCTDDEKNRIEKYGKPYRGISYWNGKEWSHNQYDTFNIDDSGECGLCDSDNIYAWADAIMEAPKMIYPSRKIEIDPADYHLTEAQLMNFLDDYKRSYERGYTK